MHKTPPNKEGENIFESPVGPAYNLSKRLATPVDNIHK